MDLSYQDKADWITTNKKIEYGRNIYDCYKSSNGQYDILHIEGNNKKLGKTLYFPVNPQEKLNRTEVATIVAQAYIGLF